MELEFRHELEAKLSQQARKCDSEGSGVQFVVSEEERRLNEFYLHHQPPANRRDQVHPRVEQRVEAQCRQHVRRRVNGIFFSRSRLDLFASIQEISLIWWDVQHRALCDGMRILTIDE